MTIMAIGTGILGLTPSYEGIGLLAPALIVVARLLQGFSAGGELGAANDLSGRGCTRWPSIFAVTWKKRPMHTNAIKPRVRF